MNSQKKALAVTSVIFATMIQVLYWYGPRTNLSPIMFGAIMAVLFTPFAVVAVTVSLQDESSYEWRALHAACTALNANGVAYQVFWLSASPSCFGILTESAIGVLVSRPGNRRVRQTASAIQSSIRHQTTEQALATDVPIINLTDPHVAAYEVKPLTHPAQPMSSAGYAAAQRILGGM